MKHEGARFQQKSFKVWATDRRVGVESDGNPCVNCVYFRKKSRCRSCNDGLYKKNFKARRRK